MLQRYPKIARQGMRDMVEGATLEREQLRRIKFDVTDEKYAHSLRSVQRVGRLAAAQLLETPEGLVANDMLRTDFDTALGEMLNTDVEFREQLDINPRQTYAIHGNHVVTKDGDAITDMITRGLEKSREAAGRDPRMRTQVLRDEADLRNAEAVERLPIGRLRKVISMDPKEAMARDGEEFWANQLGYRRGLAFVQWYYRVDEHTLWAGSYSIEGSDKATFAQLFARHGQTVEADLPSEQWIEQAIETDMPAYQAEQDAAAFRREYYELSGQDRARHSATDFIQKLQKPLVDDVYNRLYVPLAEASASGYKNQVMHDLATNFAQSPAISVGIREQLQDIIRDPIFDAGAARLMEFLIRYQAVEALRRQLPRLLATAPNAVPETFGVSYVPLAYEDMIRLAAMHVHAGAAAGRTYGGCAAGFALSKSRDNDPRNPQGAFGGVDDAGEQKESWQWKRGMCRIDNCPTRPKSTDIGPCKVCRGCQQLFDEGEEPTVYYKRMKRDDFALAA